ncbi:uncharacterized protein IL334_001534 [Kwoniella shivajii]|uniref:Inner centromere protein ARK-binding domain-containing protein n=1 Tax=Kwoniella shivajii TaxID=564305 RepID=A0ABZ1CS70_9TREE|nr:hypothetical protein IL334_001534 [Kwoniella shivajii]
MTANPPIRTIPIQELSPNYTVKRFLSSIQPHILEHVRQGTDFFRRVHHTDNDQDPIHAHVIRREASGHWQDHDVGTSELGHRAVLEETDSRGGYRQYGHMEEAQKYTPVHNPGIRNMQRYPSLPRTKIQPDPVEDNPVQHHFHTPNDHTSDHTTKLRTTIDNDRHNSNQRFNRDQQEDLEESESAQRLLARKLRRRDKAAIIKPKPPTQSHPRNGSRTSRKRGQQPSEAESPPVSRQKTIQAENEGDKKLKSSSLLDVARKYQAKNIYASNGRLSIAPQQRQKKVGFMAHGVASAPIRFQSTSKRQRQSEKAFSENEFLGLRQSQQPVSEDEDEDLTVDWERQPRGRHPALNAGNIGSKTTNRRSEEVRYSTNESQYRPYPPSVQAPQGPYSRLPLPGRTNSPSWPTVSSQASKRIKVFNPPSSARTLSKISMKGEEEAQEKRKRKAEIRQRDISVVKANERLEAERVELEKLKYEKSEKEQHQQRGMEREWEERKRMEKMERDETEWNNSQKDLRRITEKNKWRIPDNHFLHYFQSPGPTSADIGTSHDHQYLSQSRPVEHGALPPVQERPLPLPPAKYSHHTVNSPNPINVAPRRPVSIIGGGGGMPPPPMPVRAFHSTYRLSIPGSPAIHYPINLKNSQGSNSRLPPATPRGEVFGRKEPPIVPRQPVLGMSKTVNHASGGRNMNHTGEMSFGLTRQERSGITGAQFVSPSPVNQAPLRYTPRRNPPVPAVNSYLPNIGTSWQNPWVTPRSQQTFYPTYTPRISTRKGIEQYGLTKEDREYFWKDGIPSG